MLPKSVVAGSTSVMIPIRVWDSSSSTGAYLSGLTHASSGLVGRYRRRGSSAWTSITIVTATAGTFTSGGWAVPTSGPSGSYEVHIPDAAFAAGADWVEIEFGGVANMYCPPMLVELTTPASNVTQVNADATAASNLAATATAIVTGTVGASSTTTSIVTSAVSVTPTVADQFKGRVVIFRHNTTTTALRGQVCEITASSNSGTPTLTVSALTTAPSSGDTFVIV